MLYLFTKFGIENYDNLENLKEETNRDLQHCIIANDNDLLEYNYLFLHNQHKFYAQFSAAQQNAVKHLKNYLQNTF